MQLNKTRMYPYPILWEENQDYLNAEFLVEYFGCKKHGINIKFKFNIDVTDKYIHDLISQNKARVILHMENSKTKYRNTFILNFGINEIEVKSSLLNGKIELATLIVLNEDIEYLSDNVAECFKGIKFKLPSGSILGIGSQYSDCIDKETNDLTKLNSIISVIKHEDHAFKGFEISCDRKEKIYIKLPEKSYLNYSKISSREDCRNTIFSMLIIPAIEFALNYMKENIKEDYEFDEYADYRWFKVLCNKMKDILNVKINAEFISNMNVLEIAQQLMDYPINLALKELNGGE